MRLIKNNKIIPSFPDSLKRIRLFNFIESNGLIRTWNKEGNYYITMLPQLTDMEKDILSLLESNNNDINETFKRQSGVSSCISWYIVYKALTSLSESIEIALVADSMNTVSNLLCNVKRILEYASNNLDFKFSYKRNNGHYFIIELDDNKRIRVFTATSYQDLLGVDVDEIIVDNAQYINGDLNADITTMYKPNTRLIMLSTW